MKKSGMVLRSMRSNLRRRLIDNWGQTVADTNHFRQDYRGIVARPFIGYVLAILILILHLTAYSQPTFFHTALFVKCRREGTYRWGEDNCQECTQGRFSLDAAFEGAECRCIPTFSVIGYPGGTPENWLYQGHHIAHAQGTAYLEYYFLLYDTREGMDYSAWDPIALGAPKKVTLVIGGTAYAHAARNVFAEGCSSVSLTETVLDQTLSVGVQACEPSPGEWERRELDTVRKILQLEWRYLGYAPPEYNNVNAHVWKAEIQVPFNSQGEWFVPFSTANCYYYYGSAAGNIGIIVCPVLRGMSLHLPTYRKGANGIREPNPYGEGDIGVYTFVDGGYVYISSDEWYVPNLWGDWSGNIVCEWDLLPPAIEPAGLFDANCGGARVLVGYAGHFPRFEITNPPLPNQIPLPTSYSIRCDVIDNEDNYREASSFRMRLHYPVEPVDRLKLMTTRACHGEVVSSFYEGTGGKLTVCISRSRSLSYTWGISGGIGGDVEIPTGPTKLVLGGTVTLNFSSETIIAAAESACVEVNPSKKDHYYLFMAAPYAEVEVWKCDLYDRSGYVGQGEICTWKLPRRMGQYRDGTVQDGTPQHLVIALISFPMDTNFDKWLEDNCPKLPCPRPGH